MPERPVPKTKAEKKSARAALSTARKLRAAGTTDEDAAGFASLDCLQWRGWVLAVLKGERSILRDITPPDQAALITRQTHGSRAKTQALRRAACANSEADAAFWREVAELL